MALDLTGNDIKGDAISALVELRTGPDDGSNNDIPPVGGDDGDGIKPDPEAAVLGSSLRMRRQTAHNMDGTDTNDLSARDLFDRSHNMADQGTADSFVLRDVELDERAVRALADPRLWAPLRRADLQSSLWLSPSQSTRLGDALAAGLLLTELTLGGMDAAILPLLVSAPLRWLSRLELLTLFWPEDDEESALAAEWLSDLLPAHPGLRRFGFGLNTRKWPLRVARAVGNTVGRPGGRLEVFEAVKADSTAASILLNELAQRPDISLVLTSASHRASQQVSDRALAEREHGRLWWAAEWVPTDPWAEGFFRTSAGLCNDGAFVIEPRSPQPGIAKVSPAIRPDVVLPLATEYAAAQSGGWQGYIRGRAPGGWVLDLPLISRALQAPEGAHDAVILGDNDPVYGAGFLQAYRNPDGESLMDVALRELAWRTVGLLARAGWALDLAAVAEAFLGDLLCGAVQAGATDLRHALIATRGVDVMAETPGHSMFFVDVLRGKGGRLWRLRFVEDCWRVLFAMMCGLSSPKPPPHRFFFWWLSDTTPIQIALRGQHWNDVRVMAASVGSEAVPPPGQVGPRILETAFDAEAPCDVFAALVDRLAEADVDAFFATRREELIHLAHAPAYADLVGLFPFSKATKKALKVRRFAVLVAVAVVFVLGF